MTQTALPGTFARYQKDRLDPDGTLIDSAIVEIGAEYLTRENLSGPGSPDAVWDDGPYPKIIRQWVRTQNCHAIHTRIDGPSQPVIVKPGLHTLITGETVSVDRTIVAS